MEIKAVARRWGNSLAVVIPANMVEQQQIKENEELTVKLEKRHGKVKAGALWGFLKDWKRPTEEILKEADKGWD